MNHANNTRKSAFFNSLLGRGAQEIADVYAR